MCGVLLIIKYILKKKNEKTSMDRKLYFIFYCFTTKDANVIFNTWPSELCYQDLIAKNTILLKLIANSFLSTDPIHHIGLSQSAGLFLQRSKGGSGIEVIRDRKSVV